jgi:hypothetical protein
MGKNQMTGIEALIMNKAGWSISCKTWQTRKWAIDESDSPDGGVFYWIEANGSLVNSPYQGCTEYDVTCLLLTDILEGEWFLVQ